VQVYVYRTAYGTECMVVCETCSKKLPPDGDKASRYPAVLEGRCELCRKSSRVKPGKDRPGQEST